MSRSSMQQPTAFYTAALVCVLLLSYAAPLEAQDVFVSEVAASGSGNACDGQDWIELYNNGADPVNLTNYWLADSKGLGDSKAFKFGAGGCGATVIEPGGYLVLCKDAPCSFGFGIGGDDTVTLYDTLKVELHSTGTMPNESEEGKTFALIGDGFNYTDASTPGFRNRPGPPIWINEVSADGSSGQCGGGDWIELYNAGSKNHSLMNFWLSDDKGVSHLSAFKFGAEGCDVLLVAGGHLVVCKAAASPCSFTFGIGGDDTVTLYNADKQPLDTTGKMPDAGDVNITFARLPDGSGLFAYTEMPTPGHANPMPAGLEPLPPPPPPQRPCSNQSRRAVLRGELWKKNSWLGQDVFAAKYGKMGVSPFTFFRGAAHMYYKDLADKRWLEHNQFDGAAGSAWIQGDMHFENFGIFHDSTGEIVLDLNDFDEGYVASYLYDLYRFATSAVLVARENKQWTNESLRAIVTDGVVSGYLKALEAIGNDPSLVGTKVTSGTAEAGTPWQKMLQDTVQGESREIMLGEWTHMVNGSSMLYLNGKKSDKLGEVQESVKLQIAQQVESYIPMQGALNGAGSSFFSVKDVAKSIDAGTGSLGTPRFHVLVEGPTDAPNDDVLLDVKEQSWPAMHEYVPQEVSARMTSLFSEDQQAVRVATAQMALAKNSDLTLGYLRVDGKPYSVRQRSPWKEDACDLTKLRTPELLTQYSAFLAGIMAKAHSRSSTESAAVQRDFAAAMIKMFSDGEFAAQFREHVLERAVAYADQTEEDHSCFLELVSSGEAFELGPVPAPAPQPKCKRVSKAVAERVHAVPCPCDDICS